MRCPKCHYLSFEPEPRCKNCGYDLSFSPADLLTKAEEPPAEQPRELSVHLAEPEPAPEATQSESGRLEAQPSPSTELPLFVQALSSPDDSQPETTDVGGDDGPQVGRRSSVPDDGRQFDPPLVKLPPAPRAPGPPARQPRWGGPPLAVRRPTPAHGRLREKYHRPAPVIRQPELTEEPDLLASVELQLPPGMAEPPPVSQAASASSASVARGWPPVVPSAADIPAAAPEELAGAGRRIEAAAVDVLLLGAINVVVVWLTLQRCDLTFGEIALLPILPMAAFLFVLDGGYLLMFTATNGQTIGKMAAGIRVVGESDVHDRVTLKQAVLRAVLTFPSVLALGLGFVPALVGRRLALHDRFTHTRVVRA